MKKRLLGIVLVVLMALMILPSISFADTTYTDWEATNALPTASGAYKLKNDVNITSTQTIGAYASSKTTTVTLDLNGHTVKFNNAHYYVQNTGSLIIEDSVGTGLMTNEGSSSSSGKIIHIHGNCQINGGTIKNTTSSGWAVYVKGNCEINGGTIENTASSGYALFMTNDNKQITCTMNDGKIIDSNTSGAKAVQVNENATFIMNGGKIESKAAGKETPAIFGNSTATKIIIAGGTIEATGTGIDAANLPVEITAGTIDAGSYALKTRYATINPAEGKEVNISAGEAVLRPYSTPSTGEGNQIMGGNFDAPQLKSGSENNVKVSGGTFNIDVSEFMDEDSVQMDDGNGNIVVFVPIYLDKPTNVKWDGTKATWDEVPNADGYGIRLTNGEWFTQPIWVDGTSYDFSEYLTDKNGEYIFEVIAEGNGNPYFASDVALSEEYVFPEEPKEDDDEEDKPIIEDDEEDIKDNDEELKEDKPTTGETSGTQQQPDEDKKEEPKEEDKKGEKDETPTTGSVDVVLFVSAIVAVISVAGIVTVKKYTR